MRKVTIFYDGSYYTFKWLKPLLWADKEFKELGYSIGFKNIFEYLPIKNKFDTIKYNSSHGEYDILMLALHHSHFEKELSKNDIIKILLDFRQRCKTLIWMDTSDSTGTTFFEVLPYVDMYFKKQYLVDTDTYTKKIWGGRIFCEYYHEKYGVNDEEIENKEYLPIEKHYENKLRLSWNVGLGDLFSEKYSCFLKPHKIEKPEYILPESQKKYDIHFRGSAWSTAAGYQRFLTRNALDSCSYLSHPDASKKVPHEEYVQELKESKAILSPFGWGEICTRDFEAFTYGAVLIKPDMDHMITFPNWYKKFETYIPLDWDFNNVNEVFQMIKENQLMCREIALNGQHIFSKFRDNDSGKKLFAQHLVNEIEKNGES